MIDTKQAGKYQEVLRIDSKIAPPDGVIGFYIRNTILTSIVRWATYWGKRSHSFPIGEPFPLGGGSETPFMDRHLRDPGRKFYI